MASVRRQVPRPLSVVERPAARYHGDQATAPGLMDFAVNVRSAGPPPWLIQRLAGRLDGLGSYPSSRDVQRATAAVAARHRRDPDEVLLLAGGAEGFALLPQLRSRRAALLAPSFTEPEVALARAGIPVEHVMLQPPYRLSDADVPDDADLVVLGNPTNPTAVLHGRDDVLALRRPGRTIVVDEAFADAVPGEAETLSRTALPDVVVLRSLTKTWSLAGLRAGYALGAPDVLARMAAARPSWPVSTLALEAIAACCEPDAVREAAAGARALAELRSDMVAGLREVGVFVVDGLAPFVLFGVPDAAYVRNRLLDRGIAIRRCDTFVGLGDHHLRAAVRPEWPLLAAALAEAMP